MTRPLPAGSKVLVGLDHGAQAGLRVIIDALNSKDDNPHEVFRGVDAVRGSAWMSDLVSII